MKRRRSLFTKGCLSVLGSLLFFFASNAHATGEKPLFLNEYIHTIIAKSLNTLPEKKTPLTTSLPSPTQKLQHLLKNKVDYKQLHQKGRVVFSKLPKRELFRLVSRFNLLLFYDAFKQGKQRVCRDLLNHMKTHGYDAEDAWEILHQHYGWEKPIPHHKLRIQNPPPSSQDSLHTTLDMVGLFPLVGGIADGANALLHLKKGNFKNAGFSAAGIIPFIGMGSTAIKYSVKHKEMAELTVNILLEGVEHGSEALSSAE